MQPVLEISGDDLAEPHRRLEAWIWIRAVMLWPLNAEEERRRRARLAIDVFEMKHMLEGKPAQQIIPLPASMLLQLIEGVASLPEFERELETRQRRGSIAGAVLIEALRNDLTGGRRRPVKLDGIFATLAEKWPASESEIETVAWRHFRGVAHLWAAGQVTDEKVRLPDDLALWLGIAEQLRRRGESEPVRGGTIFRPGETWRPPAGLGLPEIQLVIELGS